MLYGNSAVYSDRTAQFELSVWSYAAAGPAAARCQGRRGPGGLGGCCRAPGPGRRERSLGGSRPCQQACRHLPSLTPLLTVTESDWSRYSLAAGPPSHSGWHPTVTVQDTLPAILFVCSIYVIFYDTWYIQLYCYMSNILPLSIMHRWIEFGNMNYAM